MASVPLPFMEALIKALTPQEGRESQLLGGPPTFLLGGPQGPVYAPPGGGPQPNAGPGAWSRLGRALTGPQATAGLSAAGLSLLQPNWMGTKAGIGNAIARGFEAMAYYEAQRREQAEKAFAQQYKKSELELEERRVATAEATGKAQAEAAREGVKVQREQLAAQTKHQEQMLRVALGELDVRRKESEQRQREYTDDLASGRATAAKQVALDTARLEHARAQTRVEGLKAQVELAKLREEQGPSKDLELLQKVISSASIVAERNSRPLVAAMTAGATGEVDPEAVAGMAEEAVRSELRRQVAAYADLLPPERKGRFVGAAERFMPGISVPPQPPGAAVSRTTRQPVPPTGEVTPEAVLPPPATGPTPARPTATVPPTGPTRPTTTAPARSHVGQPATRPPGTPARDTRTGEMLIVDERGIWQRLNP